jgi:hypothetical protein
MKLRLSGAVKRLNVEHRTSNIERPILMTLRFIDFKTSEPQLATSPSASSGLEYVESSRIEFRRKASLLQRRRLLRVLLSSFNKIDRIHYSMLDVQCSMFDVHQFLFRFDRPFFWPAAGLNPEPVYACLSLKFMLSFPIYKA